LRQPLINLWQGMIGVVNRATTLIAIACAAFAVMQEVSGRTILPTWIWWSAALVLLLLSGVGLQWQLMKERAKAVVPQPDRTLSGIISQILGTQDPESLGASTRCRSCLAGYARRPVSGSYRCGAGRTQSRIISTFIRWSASRSRIGAARKSTSSNM